MEAFLVNQNSIDVKTFAREYIKRLESLLNNLDVDAVEKAVKILDRARSQGNTVFTLGNGGSAATANHMALDLSFCTRMCSGPRMRAISLVSNISYISAAANDLDYDQIFVQQLSDLLVEEDVVIAISASGNSPNVIKAVEYANEKGAQSIGFLGFDGGRLRELCDVVIHIDSEEGDYGPVEDMHMILDHLITAYFIDRG